MTAYLFGWNPKQRRPESISDAVREVDVRGSTVLSWRSGSRRTLPVGSRAFLIRLGAEPRGIIGAGWTRSEPDDEPSVDIEFEKLSEAPIVPFEVLERPPFSEFHWAIQGSGVALPEEIAADLELLVDDGEQQSESALIHEMTNAPSVDEYVRALTTMEGRVQERHRLLFRAHYAAPNRVASAKELAARVGIESHAVVNSLYGRLGHDICDFLHVVPEMRPAQTYRWWSVWSRGWRAPNGFVWQMLPQVAAALESLGWVSQTDFASPDDVPERGLAEGSVKRVVVNAYERNSEARDRCIAHYGCTCFICKFDFGQVYGAVARGYIHVHHLRPISEIGSEYTIDPIADLRPVCPNCHSVLHLRNPPYTVEELGNLLESESTVDKT